MPKFNDPPSIGGAGMQSEKKLARRLGGRLTPGSGHGLGRSGAKGDMTLDGDTKFLLEAKSTINASMSLKLDWLQKINGEAYHTGREPALAVQFVLGDGDPVPGGSWVMIPERVFNKVFRGED